MRDRAPKEMRYWGASKERNPNWIKTPMQSTVTSHREWNELRGCGQMISGGVLPKSIVFLPFLRKLMYGRQARTVINPNWLNKRHFPTSIFYHASVIIASSPFLCRSLAPSPVAGFPLFVGRSNTTTWLPYFRNVWRLTLFAQLCGVIWWLFRTLALPNAPTTCIRLYLKAKNYSSVWKKFSSTPNFSCPPHLSLFVLETGIATRICLRSS